MNSVQRHSLQRDSVPDLRSRSTPARSEIRSTQGITPTKYRYTGQLAQAELGLDYYVARWYDPVLGHFAQADTIVPEPGEASAFDRYAYVQNNPLRYNDPSGHDVGCAGTDASNCSSWNHVKDRNLGYRTKQNYPTENEIDEKRKDNLISRILKGSGGNGQWWLPSDWDYYYENRDYIWENPNKWINPDALGVDGWADRMIRFSNYYTNDNKDQFVRDFGLVWGGVPENRNIIMAVWSVRSGPHELNFLNESTIGLNEDFYESQGGIQSPSDNQSHHYTGIFLLSYYFGRGGAAIVGYAREIEESNWGDINLGNRASNDAFRLRNIDSPQNVVDYIRALSN